VKGPKIYMASAKANEADDQTKTPETGAQDLGKSTQTKEIAKER